MSRTTLAKLLLTGDGSLCSRLILDGTRTWRAGFTGDLLRARRLFLKVSKDVRFVVMLRTGTHEHLQIVRTLWRYGLAKSGAGNATMTRPIYESDRGVTTFNTNKVQYESYFVISAKGSVHPSTQRGHIL